VRASVAERIKTDGEGMRTLQMNLISDYVKNYTGKLSRKPEKYQIDKTQVPRYLNNPSMLVEYLTLPKRYNPVK
jgi:hypothetical protein